MPTAFDRALDQSVGGVIAETIHIAEIPAPTFREGARGAYVRDRLETIGGWSQLTVDGLSNVVAVRRGEPGRARVLVGAHLDTVFPDAETPVVRERGKLVGRGVGDNSLGVAALLAFAGALQRANPHAVGDLILAANVGEEGLGDLRGVKRVIKDYAADFDCMLAIEGHALNSVQTAAVASLRYEVSVETEGGHSWGAYGRPNAISLLARAIVALEGLMPEVGATPKVTMNVGVIRGGRSVNTIAPDAAFELDMRSADVGALGRLHQQARAAMRAAVGAGVDLRLRRIGNRPGGTIAEDAPLIRTVLGARGGLGLPLPEFRASSTDANAAVAAGYPATCIGVTTGGESHTPREWIRTAPIKQGVPYVGRAIVAVAGLPAAELRTQPSARRAT